MTVKIKTVTTKHEKNEFIDLAWQLHGNDPNWISPLRLAVKNSLDTEKHPFYKQAKLQLWNAYRNGKCVGRIAGIINDAHNNFHEEKVVFWGFFECENNLETATALFNSVENWGKQNGMQILRGPVSPSTNYECGLQISAFETQPYIMMTQNPPYYVELVEKNNHFKAKDLNAWLLDGRQAEFHSRLLSKAKQAEKQESITFRHLDMKRFDEEVENILKIYNDAWEKNWGFVPMSDAEFRQMAKEMKSIVVPELIFIVEVNGEIAGFSLWLPDLNQVMAKIRNGNLFPTGLFKLIWHTKIKKSVTQGRILTLGIRKKFQALQLGPMMYLRYLELAPKLGYPLCECSWILEDNKAMNFGLKLMGAKNYKTYRVYDKSL